MQVKKGLIITLKKKKEDIKVNWYIHKSHNMIAIVTNLTNKRMDIKNIDGFSSIKLILNLKWSQIQQQNNSK